MRVLFTLSIVLAVAIVNCHDFKGPLNFKNFSATTFNVEDELQVVVGNIEGQLMVSKFSKNAQIVNYKTERTHYAQIVGIKRLPTKQYLTIGSKGIFVKWTADLKKKLEVAISHPRDTNILNVAFITNEQAAKGNTRFAVNQGDEVHVFSTVDLKKIVSFNCTTMFNTSECAVNRISYINNILLVYGYDTPIIAIDMLNRVRNVSTPLDVDFYYVSQFNSINDNKSPDGIAITSLNHIVHFNLTVSNTTPFGVDSNTNISRRSLIDFDPNVDGSIQSVNYCKRRNFNPATMKTQKYENIILVGFRDKLWFYQFNNETRVYEHGESYQVDNIIEIQCQEDEVFVLANNGKNNIIQILSLEYIYHSTKDSGFTDFLIVALIILTVTYQINKYRLKQKHIKESNEESRYVQLEDRVTVVNTYNN